MEGVVVLAVVIIVVVAIAAIAFGQKARQDRIATMQAFAGKHRWDYVEQDDSYAKRWPGPPFSNGGTAKDLISGEHRGRRFLSFTHTYTTSSYNGTTTTTQNHVHAIHTLTLPDRVPALSVGAEGIFGGKVAEAFGFGRVDVGDAAFDDTFKVKSDNPDFARAVLQPALVEHLKQTGPWDWRFAENSMINVEKGQVDPEAITAHLDRMIEVLDRIDPSVWPGGQGHLR
ncbi:hypothetical protein ACQBAR_13700 [Propionibacteriaceae bacterium Y1685]|uniref:hypothetical protein n=1 Tax=Microlunatus sp. Y1700 TaxID=3418487 RepID=UPI003B766359